jgi:hypothetical protein
MLLSMKQILQKYRSLVMHIMFDEHAFKAIAKSNLELHCDSETIMGFTCVLSLFECMQNISKFVQSHVILILLL